LIPISGETIDVAIPGRNDLIHSEKDEDECLFSLLRLVAALSETSGCRKIFFCSGNHLELKYDVLISDLNLWQDVGTCVADVCFIWQKVSLLIFVLTRFSGRDGFSSARK
jgi:hypothetical protein